jgi:hypothetical protein
VGRKLRLAGLEATANYYAVLDNSDAFMVLPAGPTLEAYNEANWANYDIATVPQGTSGRFVVDIPTGLPDDQYGVDIRLRATGAPLPTDVTVMGGTIDFRNDSIVGIWGIPADVNDVLSIDHGVGPWGSGESAGARTVVLTVTDGTDPLESARVRVTKGATTFVATTNVGGTVTFNLDDGTWTVAITLFGYSFAGTNLIVNGDEAETYAMGIVVIPPSGAGRLTGFLYTYDENGEEEANVPVTLEAIKIPATVTGIALDGLPRTETSAIDGLTVFTNLFNGVTYRLTRGDGIPVRITVPLTAADPWEMIGAVGPEIEV